MEAIGQDALTRRLARHAEEGSLAHAMLLTGAPGRGGLDDLRPRAERADAVERAPELQNLRLLPLLEKARPVSTHSVTCPQTKPMLLD